MSKITEITENTKINQLIERLQQTNESADIQEIKITIQSEISQMTKNIIHIEKNSRGEYGKLINKLKNEFQNVLKSKNTNNSKKKRENINYSMLISPTNIATLHPLTVMQNKLYSIFNKIGFQHVSSKEIEDDFHNFDGLNIQEDHPARTDHDTFYVRQNAHQHINKEINQENNHQKLSLRTQTSTSQIYVLTEFFLNRYSSHPQSEIEVLNQKITVQNVRLQSITTQNANEVDMRVVSSGKVYRSDHDSTHVPMFHQMEAMAVGENITIANLKWVLTRFCEELFELPDLKMRLRPNFFPFTEPSLEVDIAYKKTEFGIELIKNSSTESHLWMEVLGSGMINKEVLKKCGMKEDDAIQGFALGMGIDRITMLFNKIPSLSHFYGKADVRWLNDFGKIPQTI